MRCSVRYPGLMKKCKASGCTRTKILARGLCSMHYQRTVKRGEPVLSEQRRMTPKERICDATEERHMPGVDLVTPCWVATTNGNANGYARISIGGHRDYLHRHSYRAFKGEIPEGYEVDHLCQIRECGQPDHLEAVTAEENKRRTAERRTECPSGHKYTPENTYRHVTETGVVRHCRTCHREQVRAASAP